MATKKTRSNRHGTIRQRGPNTWQLRFEKPRAADGKRSVGSETFQGSRYEALDRLNVIVKEIREGAFVKPSDQRLSAFLDRWIIERVRTSSKINRITADGYQSLIDRYVRPAPIAEIPIGKLAPRHIEGLYASLRAPERQPKPLAEGTVLKLHNILVPAFDWATREDFLAKNPMSNVDRPSPAKPTIVPLEHPSYGAFLEAIEPSPYGDLYLVALFTGMRRSELLGLEWRFVDIDRGVVSVRQTLQRVKGRGLQVMDTKTQKSKRDLTIDGPGLETLRRIRVAQMEHALAHGMRWSERWFVFCRADGGPFDPNRLSREFRARMDSIGITAVTLHGLRHTHASWLVEAGEDYKVIADRLGHASIVTTLDLYSHLQQTASQRAAARFTEFAESQ